MKPLVSIIIPTFNREHLIGETLDSVLAQTYQNWECIVVDDGSTDKTEKVLQEYINRDKRFNYYKRTNNYLKGASGCRNNGIKLSKGDYLQFLDSDDILSDFKIESQINLLVNQGNKAIATCKWGRFDHLEAIRKQLKVEYNSYKDFNSGYLLLESFGVNKEFFPPHVYLINKFILQSSGFWDESLTNNDDGEFFTRVLLHTEKVIFSPIAEVYYRELDTFKLSVINTDLKVKSAIKSWELIEEHILNQEGCKNVCYVKNAKDYLYLEIKKYNPSLINNYRQFFEEQIKYNSFFNKLKRKLV
ncbi:glycosyltransferase family 2 protein [Formosa haliotis]|uniref:glycosyltransferase family 2 protein n=1 Tax=Formosa haliotis TaxID=1555194 RepID=UPI00082452E8|nr:glycosyltransferase family 2 protein [Formosa haliotis]